MQYIFTLIYALFIFILLSCDPLVTEFSNDETPKKYTSKTLTTAPNKDTLTVASWNIRFGIGRAKWFGDSCGDIVIFDDEQIKDGLELLAKKISEIDADILLLQKLESAIRGRSVKDILTEYFGHKAPLIIKTINQVSLDIGDHYRI